MAIAPSSVTSKTIRIKAPSGTYFEVDSVVYTSANGQATYKFARTFTATDNGKWEVYTSETDKVLDGAGNAVVGGALLGSFNVNIPTPAGDTTIPTATLVSITPTEITTAGNTTVDVVVRFTDA